MNKLYHCEKLFFKVAALTCTGVLFLFTVLLTHGCATPKEDRDYINYISFSHDGKKILFDRRKGEGFNQIHVYDLEIGELSAYQSPPDEKWSMARYSNDGKYIVFAIYPRRDNRLEVEKMQLAIMEPDGTNIRQITTSSGPKIFPSFSHKDDKVIFAKAGVVREKGRTPAADFDVYEVNIKTGEETRLTNFKFFELQSPFYFPDDKTFIFSADYPSLELGNMREEIRSKHNDNTIYAMQGGQKVLKPYFEFYSYSKRPLLSVDGKRLIFRSHGDPVTKGGWTQFYLYSPDGNHRQITNRKEWRVLSGAVSPDGEQLAIVFEINAGTRIAIYRIQDGSFKEISLPDHPLRIINQYQ